MATMTTTNPLLVEKPVDNATRFVALVKEERALEASLKDVQRQKAALEEVIVDEWADRGQTSVNIDGMNLHIHGEFYCSKRKEAEMSQVCRMLESQGLGRLVNKAPSYHAAALKSAVKEIVDQGNVPEVFGKMLNFDTKYRLRTRAS